jgi:hypothetical protein
MTLLKLGSVLYVTQACWVVFSSSMTHIRSRKNLPYEPVGVRSLNGWNDLTLGCIATGESDRSPNDLTPEELRSSQSIICLRQDLTPDERVWIIKMTLWAPYTLTLVRYDNLKSMYRN